MTAKGTAVVGTQLSNNYQAEARLLRALSYYSLLQLYARPFGMAMDLSLVYLCV